MIVDASCFFSFFSSSSANFGMTHVFGQEKQELAQRSGREVGSPKPSSTVFFLGVSGSQRLPQRCDPERGRNKLATLPYSFPLSHTT
jgi:hypothetical protein